MNRGRFLAALTGGPLLGALQPFDDPGRIERVPSALVLGGGGARGAYEAGIVDAIRAVSNTADGQPLPGVDVVCGTSIGAVNSWFVATGQYSKLAALWHGVAGERVFEIKRRFAATANPHAFLITKIVQALSLAEGLTTDVQGVLEGNNVARFLAKHIDLSVPLVVPLVFNVTNLDRSRAEIFYRLPFVATDDARAAAIARIQRTVGPSVAVRPLSDDLLRSALQASTAIPVLFDPVVLPSPEGTFDRYIDGGIADNNPIDVGRALARSVYAVLLDPPHPARSPYNNALEIAVGAFGIAQERILEASLTAAYRETRGKRLFDDPSDSGARRAYLDTVLDVDLYVIRPATDLTADPVEFDRQDKIDATFAEGVSDFARGWAPFTAASDPGASQAPEAAAGGRSRDGGPGRVRAWTFTNPTPSAMPSSSSVSAPAAALVKQP